MNTNDLLKNKRIRIMDTKNRYRLAKIWTLFKELIGLDNDYNDIFRITSCINETLTKPNITYQITDVITFNKTVYVATNRAGLLIGKAGENIYRIAENIKKETKFNKVVIIDSYNSFYNVNYLDHE